MADLITHVSIHSFQIMLGDLLTDNSISFHRVCMVSRRESVSLSHIAQNNAMTQCDNAEIAKHMDPERQEELLH